MRLLQRAWKFFKRLNFYIHMVLAMILAKVLFVKTGSVWYSVFIYGLYPFIVLNFFQGEENDEEPS